MSGLGKSKSCFITLVERKSRFYKVIKSPNRHADVVARLIIDYLKQYPSELVKTITTDNGKEFAEWEQIEKELNCEVYFCDTSVLGRRDQMRIQMDFLESSFLKVII